MSNRIVPSDLIHRVLCRVPRMMDEKFCPLTVRLIRIYETVYLDPDNVLFY